MDPHPGGRSDSIDDLLLRLRARGFRFAAEQDPGGVIVALIGVRVHHGVIDILELYGEDDTLALRIPGDEPNVMRPSTTLWRTSGVASEVIDLLLALPDPPHRPEVDPPGECWLDVAPDRLIWLPADSQL